SGASASALATYSTRSRTGVSALRRGSSGDGLGVPPEERAHGIGHAGAVLQPLLEAGLIHLHLTRGRTVGAQGIEEAAVPATARVRRDDVVVGGLLGARPAQSNGNRHRILTLGGQNAAPLGSEPSYRCDRLLSRQAARDGPEDHLQILVGKAQPSPGEEVASQAEAPRQRIVAGAVEGVVQSDREIEVGEEGQVGVGADAREAPLRPSKVENVGGEADAVVEEVQIHAET